MSRLASEGRSLAFGLLLSGFLAVAPSSVAPWRLEPRPAPGIVLAVGDPTRSLWVGR